MNQHPLRTMRKKKGISQAKLAEQVGCTSAYVCMVEKGKEKGSEAFFEKAAEVIGCEPGNLFRRS